MFQVMPSHKIASRQAELARKKRKHHEPNRPEELQANAATTEAGAVTAPPQVPDEVRARPSLMSSYRAVSTQPEAARKTSTNRSAAASTQTEYFSADIRRLMVTIAISLALLAGLTFALR